MPFYGSIQGSYGLGRAPVSGDTKYILMIYDVLSSDMFGLASHLNSKRIRTQFVSRASYNGSNPPPYLYDAVVMFDGTTYNEDLAVGAQTALTSYVYNGGKYISSEWDAFQVGRGRLASMTDLVLLMRDRAFTGAVNYVIRPEHAAHPLFVGFTESVIRLPVTGYNIGPIRDFSLWPVTLLADQQDATGDVGAGIAVRTYNAGKIVYFSHAGNYVSGVLSDPVVQQLYYNAIVW
jgi:hypothetical protein